MTRLDYTLMTDTLFKLLFVKYPGLLQKLVSTLLGVPYTEIYEFHIKNPEIPPDQLGEKFCRLDINMVVNDQRVNLEIQVTNEYDYPERILYHWAREYSSSLPAGVDYKELPRVIVISILDFVLFTDSAAFSSEFRALEITRHIQLSDKICLLFYELPKINEEITSQDELLLWLSLFKAKTEEDLHYLEALEVPDMTEAIDAYRRVAVSPELRELERVRDLARHNEAAAIRNAATLAKHEARIETAYNLILLGYPTDSIAKATSLSPEEVDALRSPR